MPGFLKLLLSGKSVLCVCACVHVCVDMHVFLSCALCVYVSVCLCLHLCARYFSLLSKLLNINVYPTVTAFTTVIQLINHVMVFLSNQLFKM